MRGSTVMATTVWAILSATVGTPSTRTPRPCGLGISTAFTAGGKYVPEDIRFHIRYRLFLRSFSKSSIVTPSTPAAPLIGLDSLVCLPHELLGNRERLVLRVRRVHPIPPSQAGCPNEHIPDEPAPFAVPSTTRASSLLRAGPPAGPATVLDVSRFPPLDALPLATRTPGRQQCRDPPSQVPRRSRRPGSRRLHAGHRLASKRDTRQAHPRT